MNQSRSFAGAVAAAAILVSSACLAEQPPVFQFSWGGTTTYSGLHLSYPRGIARGPGGVIYVSDSSNFRILKFSSTGQYLQQILIEGSFPLPSGLDVDASGNIYVACTGSHQIMKYSPTGVHLATYGSRGTGPLQFMYPYAVAVDDLGFIYVGDKDNDRIQKLNPDGTYNSEWNGETAGTGRFRPVYMKLAPNGYLYVADGPNSRVLSFTTSGTLGMMYSLSDGCPGQSRNVGGLAVDTSGDCYVMHMFLGCAEKISSSGVFLCSWGSVGTALGQFYRPDDMELSTDGTLIYVVDGDNDRIQVFSQAVPTPIERVTWSAIKARVR